MSLANKTYHKHNMQQTNHAEMIMNEGSCVKKERRQVKILNSPLQQGKAPSALQFGSSMEGTSVEESSEVVDVDEGGEAPSSHAVVVWSYNKNNNYLVNVR